MYTAYAYLCLYISFFLMSVLLAAHFLWKDMNGKVRSSLRPVNPKQSKKERKEALNSQGKSRHTASRCRQQILAYPRYAEIKHSDWLLQVV